MRYIALLGFLANHCENCYHFEIDGKQCLSDYSNFPLSRSMTPQIMMIWEQTGYSVVCACVVVLRVSPEDQEPPEDISISSTPLRCIIATAGLGFGMGLSYRLSAHPAVIVGLFLLEILIVAPMYTHQVS